MSRRSSTAWARSLARAMGKVGRQVMQAQSKAVGQAVGQAVSRQAGVLTVPLRKRAAAKKRAAARVAAAAGRWTSGVAVAAGCARRWRLYIPPGLTAGVRPPLLVLLHGCGQDAEGFAAVTAMHKLADRGGFLVLLPEQDRLASAQGCWNWFDTEQGRAQAEADAVLAAIDQVCLRRADRRRVVVAGLSAGAGLAALLALRHPQRLRGVVMHSGVPPGTAHSTLTGLAAMRGRRATAAIDLAAATVLPPLLVIHGSLDGVVSPRNAQAAVEAWAVAGGATAGRPRRLQRGKRHPMQVTDFRHGRPVVATLVEVQGLGHAWSGGVAGLPFSDPKGPDASRLVWAFAQRVFARAT
jgi:poly(hydroxyalkanoate) depolymerase family esterase